MAARGAVSRCGAAQAPEAMSAENRGSERDECPEHHGSGGLRRGSFPSAITGQISVRNNMRDELYPKADMGPEGVSKAWKPMGRR